MPKLRQISLNANSGAFVTILASIAVSMIEFVEDEATAMVGLQFQSPQDNFATTNVLSVASEQSNEGYRIPNPHKYGINGPLLGLPAQNSSGMFNYRAADPILKARSNTSAATVLRLTEYE